MEDLKSLKSGACGFIAPETSVIAQVAKALKGINSAAARQQARIIIKSICAAYLEKPELIARLANSQPAPSETSRQPTAHGDIGSQRPGAAFRAAQAVKAMRALESELARATIRCPQCGAINAVGLTSCRCGYAFGSAKTNMKPLSGPAEINPLIDAR